MISLTITGLEELKRKYGTDLKPALRAATFAVGEQLRTYLAKYPGPAHSPVKWASEKARRYYFWLRMSKGLPLEYTRNSDPLSQRLGPSWTVAHRGQTGTVVGTRVAYARWVQGSQWQTGQHKATGWVTDEQAVEQLQRSGKVGPIVRDAVMHALGEHQ